MKNLFYSLVIMTITMVLLNSCSENDELLYDDDPVNLQIESNALSKTLVLSDNIGSSRDKLSPYVNQSEPCYTLRDFGYSYDLMLVVHPGAKRDYERVVHIWMFWNGNRNSLPATYSFNVPAHFSGSLYIESITSNNSSLEYTSVDVEISQVRKRVANSWNWINDNSSEWTEATITGIDTCKKSTDLPCHYTNDCDDTDDTF